MKQLDLIQKNRRIIFTYKKILSFLILICTTAALPAQDFIVNTVNDTHAAVPATNALDGSGNISLRSAMESSAARSGAHSISFNGTVAGSGGISLTLGTITVGGATGLNITVTGAGMNTFTITQTTAARIFSTASGAIIFKLQDIALNYAGGSGTYSGGGGAIIAGGASAVTTLINVKITNFRNQIGNGGAVSSSSSLLSHNLIITNCLFSNNACGGGGGAVSYNGLGTLTITGTTFSNDSTGIIGSNIGGSGGAVSTTGSGNGGTYSITTCTFINNTVKNVGAQGGAIDNFNGALTLQYNRFIGNTAADPANGKTVAQTGGGGAVQTIIANDNWWGQNSGPATNDAVNIGTGGTLTLTSWLQLRNIPAATAVCPSGSGTSTTLVTADILGRNTGGPIAASNLVGLAAFPAPAATIFSSPVLGTLTVASTQFINGIATVTYNAGATGGSGSVTATADAQAIAATITIPLPPVITPAAGTVCQGSAGNTASGPAGASTYAWTITNGLITSVANGQNITYTAGNTSPVTLQLTITTAAGCTLSNSANITANITNTLSGTTGGAQVCGNYAVLPAGSGGTVYTDASCNPIAKVLPSGSGPAVTGTINTCVKIDASVQTFNAVPYVQRHYDINPVTNAAAATATITLYFTQAEFNAYNTARGAFPALPTGTGDATGKANLRVTQYHGTGTAPGNYTGAAVLIDPVDANIVFNATAARWEVTFDVTGFSGFYVSTSIFAVPVTLVNFSGQNNGNQNLLEWTTALEQNSSYFELQRSSDGNNFAVITSVNAGGNSTINKTYKYSDNISGLALPVYYYRLKMVDLDGKFRFSSIARIRAAGKGMFAEVSPNPFKEKLQLSVNVATAVQDKAGVILSDISGKILLRQSVLLKKGMNVITIDEVNKFSAGVYLLTVATSQQTETLKIVKE